jgi:hypothetical protein
MTAAVGSETAFEFNLPSNSTADGRVSDLERRLWVDNAVERPFSRKRRTVALRPFAAVHPGVENRLQADFPPAAMDLGLLDRFIPSPDVRERFETTVHAPASIVMDVALNFDMQSIPVVRAIFWLRDVLLGARNHPPRRPQGILEETQSLGWGILDEQPGRAVVCGARCQPWLADVKFSALGAEEFASYSEPHQVKIAWTLEAQDIADDVTRFAQETRAVATDVDARKKFLQYWRWARFGIVAVRLLLLPAVRRASEQRWAIELSKGRR